MSGSWFSLRSKKKQTPFRMRSFSKRFNLPEKSDLNNGINANPPQKVLAEVVPSLWGDLAMELG